MIHKIAYFNSKFLPIDQISVSPFDRGFLFGDSVYEVIRYYNGEFFMLEEHISRMRYSLNQLKINFFDLDGVKKNMDILIEKNNLQKSDVIIYIQISRGVYERMLAFPPADIKPTEFMFARDVIIDYESVNNGLVAYTFEDIRWGRCDIKTTALIANVLAQQNAVSKGGKMGLFTLNGIITEGTHTSFFGVYNGEVYTHPRNSDILPGITRTVVYKLCEKSGIKVVESAIKLSDIEIMDEFFVSGTTPEITPVVKINDFIIKNGTPGPVTRLLQKSFKTLINPQQF